MCKHSRTTANCRCKVQQMRTVSPRHKIRADERGGETSMAKKSLNVNGKRVSIAYDDPDMPLLYALRDNLALHGPRFGCGLAQCGACTVHIDGKAVRSCVTPLSTVNAKQKVVTLEGPRHAAEAASGAARLHRGAGRAMRLLHQRHDHGVGGVPRQEQEADRGARSRRRSPTISAAAARMPASSRRSSAHRLRRKGGST